ncbi:MAG: hypothetical protein A2497_05795 [Candidatus Firestonebacteria bacterium RifOxyC12_full_39_7]|nr:MAG: hypothetical protein A2497_05795 [Candidatus Firestonebacteria bacterium RifOxyC12_full_39_7]
MIRIHFFLGANVFIVYLYFAYLLAVTYLLAMITHPPVILGGSFEEITKLADSADLVKACSLYI